MPDPNKDIVVNAPELVEVETPANRDLDELRRFVSVYGLLSCSLAFSVTVSIFLVSRVALWGSIPVAIAGSVVGFFGMFLSPLEGKSPWMSLIGAAACALLAGYLYTDHQAWLRSMSQF